VVKGFFAWIIGLGCSLACVSPSAAPAPEHASDYEEPTATEIERSTAAAFESSGPQEQELSSATRDRAPATERPPSNASVAPSPSGQDKTAATARSTHPDALLFDRGEGELALWIPRDEELTFRVVLELGPLGDINAGEVVLSSGVERYVSGLPSRGATESKQGELETGWIRSHASGSYAGYHLDHELRARVLPQTWPRVFYTDTQSGSESRRRELKLGLQEGAHVASYRSDGHCKGCDNPEHFVKSVWSWRKPYHCEKCKTAAHRVWKEPVRRPLPPGTVDMLSAVYLARSLVRDGRSATEFALIDKLQLWQVHLVRGANRRRITTPAGSFNAQEIKLSTSLPRGETNASKGFEGLFGIRGTLQIWVEIETGTPVLIEGELPVPVLGSLDVRVELKSSRGTPRPFAGAR
jgi:hypothetical protein